MGQVEKGFERMRLTILLAALALFLAACNENSEEAHDRGYEEGFEDGQFEVCEEIGRVSLAVKALLQSCRGL
ncbi:hypothetical protein [Phaeovulum sp.]|uniref:hypothetical protein n=1 Tax=Phaeovulum sp. TaxID=2934796 RepID=UPI002730F311|nr:hypothetical protein [Phaeovulum sp.]MDP1668590.1 hypothetical protein [Phaeovulum sp.]MDZ4119921.1 hypothetical protein [Phaeovulum sp.]